MWSFLRHYILFRKQELYLLTKEYLYSRIVISQCKYMYTVFQMIPVEKLKYIKVKSLTSLL